MSFFLFLSEASLILEAAEKSGLTSNKYLWLVTQSVIGDPGDKSINRRDLPLGMLGKCFFLLGAVHKLRQHFLADFDTPLPHISIHQHFNTPPPHPSAFQYTPSPLPTSAI